VKPKEIEIATLKAALDDSTRVLQSLKSEHLTLWDDFCVMRDRNVGLQKQVDELQAWKDAVPVDAIRIVLIGNPSLAEMFACASAVDDWLESLGRRGRERGFRDDAAANAYHAMTGE